MAVVERLIGADWRPFRVTIVGAEVVVFDARLRGVQECHVADSMERAERVAQWMNDVARGDLAREILPEWDNLRDEQTHALLVQREGFDNGERWASPLASTYRALARTSEELGRIWDAIATAENSRAMLDELERDADLRAAYQSAADELGIEL